MTVNYLAKRYFGAMKYQIQSCGKIGLTKSGGFSQVRVNGDLSCGFDTGCKNKNAKRVDEIFHKFS